MAEGSTRTERAIRLMTPGLLGLGLCAFLYVISQLSPSPISTLAIAVIVSQAYVISALCESVFRTLEKRRPGGQNDLLRLMGQLLVATGIAASYSLIVYVPIKLWLISRGERDAIGWQHLALIALSAAGVALALTLVRFTLNFFGRWQSSAMEAERHKQESLRAQLQALQAKVNPHFLFNSLNLLYGMIVEDRERAQALVLKLSDVFRYVLRQGDQSLVPLLDELTFADAYIDLLCARHAGALSVRVERLGDEGGLRIPPMTLQLLVENAVKHNAVDPERALSISIERQRDRLLVRNDRLPRRDSIAGTGLGLDNLRRRFALVDERPIEVSDDGHEFRVSVPLIRAAS